MTPSNKFSNISDLELWALHEGVQQVVADGEFPKEGQTREIDKLCNQIWEELARRTNTDLQPLIDGNNPAAYHDWYEKHSPFSESNGYKYH